MIQILQGGEWVEGSPSTGQKYRVVHTFSDGSEGYVYLTMASPSGPTTIPVLNVNHTYNGFHRVGAGGIQTIQQETICTITANVSLPDNVMTIMLVELGTNDEWINAKYRFDAEIKNGVMTLRIKLPIGNFLLSCDRINQGLDYVSAGFHLDFDDIQFNCIATV